MCVAAIDSQLLQYFRAAEIRHLIIKEQDDGQNNRFLQVFQGGYTATHLFNEKTLVLLAERIREKTPVIRVVIGQ